MGCIDSSKVHKNNVSAISSFIFQWKVPQLSNLVTTSTHMITILLTCWHNFRIPPAMGRNKTVFNVPSKQLHSCNQLRKSKMYARTWIGQYSKKQKPYIGSAYCTLSLLFNFVQNTPRKLPETSKKVKPSRNTASFVIRASIPMF